MNRWVALKKEYYVCKLNLQHFFLDTMADWHFTKSEPKPNAFLFVKDRETTKRSHFLLMNSILTVDCIYY